MSQLTVKIFGFAPSFCRLAMPGSRYSIATATNRTFATAIQSSKPSGRWQPPRTTPLVGRGNLMKSPIVCRVFQTTSRNHIPPIVFLIAKPLAKLTSIIGGRIFRKWWKKLTPEQKLDYKDRVLKRKALIGAGVGVLALACVYHFVTHLQFTPVTKRCRYVSLTTEQFLKITQFAYDVQYQMLRDKIVAPDHPFYSVIIGIVQRIINSNQDLDLLRKQAWKVTMIYSDEANASVLATGHIFVHTGLLELMNNEDQLAVVLGHEIAHVVLGHGAERLSFATLLDVIIVVVLGALWAFMPNDGVAIVANWFYHKVMKLMLTLPYGRKLEMEADEVGLQLVAKACFDIRESSVFWTAMATLRELQDIKATPQWLSTHPANETRVKRFEVLIPEAIKQRQSCNCPALSVEDPRVLIPLMQQMVEKKRRQSRGEDEDDTASTVAVTSDEPTAASQANV